MNGLCKWLVLGVGGYFLYKYHIDKKEQAAATQAAVSQQLDLPSGAVPTGKVKQTKGGPPGQETIGYQIMDWAEVRLPTGEKDWVQIQFKNPVAGMM